MAPQAGLRLGHYEVVSPIGAGGMGEVYRAHDPHLGRDVAIKVLPEDLAEDSERLLRFEREARSLAALHHPNVATVFGFDHDTVDGREIWFLVMELVDGEDLAERLERAPLEVAEAVPLFRQIAEGLEAAHEAGIVHRDLKPANIRTNQNELAKILDFGLAKPVGRGQPASDLSQSPTLTADPTLAGALLGTAPYMSPEQAKGKAIDKRTDIWAFGCCLFEALTGQRPFEADDVPSTLALILSAEPDWDALPSDTPRALRDLLKRCLDKDEKRRLRDIGEARVVLSQSEGLRSEVGAESRTTSTAASARWVSVATIVALLSLALATWLALQLRNRSAPVSAKTAYYSLAPPNGLSYLYRFVPTIAISPDGRRIASGHAGSTWLRNLEASARPQMLKGSNEWSPFFSPDGESVGTAASDALRRSPIDGGELRVVAELTELPRGASWSPDGTVVFGQGFGGHGIYRVDANGGAVEQVTTASKFEHQVFPQLLPDGETVIYTLGGTGMEPQVVAQRVGETQRTILRENAFFGRYVESGHLLFAEIGEVFAATFDPGSLVVGEPVRVLTGVITSKQELFAELDVSAEGSLVYLSGPPEDQRWIARLAPGQAPERLARQPRLFDIFRADLSPDGLRFALSADGRKSVVVFDVARSRLERVVGEGDSPVWTRDGESLVWTDASGTVLSLRVDSTAEPIELLAAEDAGVAVPWSLDPKGRLLYYVQSEETSWDLAELDLAAGTSRTLRATTATEMHPEISPDGRWLAYTVMPFEIRVTAYSDALGVDAEVRERAVGTGFCPRWSDSETLFWAWGPNVYRQRIDSTTGQAVGDPEVFVQGVDDSCSWDVAPDGSHVIAVEKREEPELILVTNWFAELERLVPTN